MNERTKSLSISILLALVVVGLMFLSYFYTSYGILVPTISGCIVLGIFIYLWWHEKSLEEQEYQFITIVTHKFRTPLTGIKWAIDSFKKEVTLEEKTDILKQMENSSNKLMEIVDLLIGFVKFNQKLEYAFEAASIIEMVQESLEKYSQRIKEKNMNFSLHSEQTIPMVIIDKRKIQFVIDMLIDNAVKYTPQGGEIAVSVEPSKKGIIVRVQDTGMGISSQELKNIFKKFYRSNEAKSIDTEGMGMGLHTAQVIMAHHGGRMWVTSPGKQKGASFFIELPLSQ